MKKNAQSYLILLLTLIMLNSCEKNQNLLVDYNKLSDKERISNAKDWYGDERHDQSISIVNSNGFKGKLSLLPDWENAIVDEIDGKFVISATVRTNVQKLVGEDARYVLLLLSDGDNYDAKIVNIKFLVMDRLITIKDLYETAFRRNDVSGNQSLNAIFKVYDHNLKSEGIISYDEKGIHFLSNEKKSGREVESTTIITTCIDWFLVYDDGTKEYFTTTCEDEEVGTIDYIAPDDGMGSAAGFFSDNEISAEPESLSMSELYQEDGEPLTRKKRYEWVFLKNKINLWNFSSIEIGIHKLVNNEWVWESLTNATYGLNGSINGVTLTVSNVSFSPNVGNYSAHQVIYYSYEGKMMVKGVPFTKNLTSSSISPSWNLH